MDSDVRYVIVFNRYFAGPCGLAALGREKRICAVPLCAATGGVWGHGPDCDVCHIHDVPHIGAPFGGTGIYCGLYRGGIAACIWH